MSTYNNRYGDEFTFEKDLDGNILWLGNFEYHRIGFPNDYTEAYDEYCDDVDTDERMTLGEFKSEVHHYDADTQRPGRIAERYAKFVKSNHEIIDMVDPPGGPYISSGHNMGRIDEEFKDMVVDRFESIDGGYKIIIK